MKYFLDTEFIEGFHKPLFGKRRHYIDLISIGIVAEDGREYYAVSSEFNPKDADQWVKENVIPKLHKEDLRKPNNLIANEIKKFIAGIPITNLDASVHFNRTLDGNITYPEFDPASCIYRGYRNYDDWVKNKEHFIAPEFYAYYADYDWVVFCSLFGRMIDLPKGFPMYCKDLKQMLDEKIQKLKWEDGILPMSQGSRNIEDVNGYPAQFEEHNALADAKWNKELYGFINSYK